MKRWPRASLVFLVMMFALLPLGDRAVAQAERYTIDVVINLTGPNAFIGSVYSKSLRVLEKYVNAHGGINGRPLKLEFYDDQTNPPGRRSTRLPNHREKPGGLFRRRSNGDVRSGRLARKKRPGGLLHLTGLLPRKRRVRVCVGRLAAVHRRRRLSLRTAARLQASRRHQRNRRHRASLGSHDRADSDPAGVPGCDGRFAAAVQSDRSHRFGAGAADQGGAPRHRYLLRRRYGVRDGPAQPQRCRRRRPGPDLVREHQPGAARAVPELHAPRSILQRAHLRCARRAPEVLTRRGRRVS